MTREVYIRQSLDGGVFWLRLMKDLVTVTANGLNMSGYRFVQPLERFRFHCEILLAECLDVGSGLVTDELRQCRALITEFTEECESVTQQLTGFVLNTRLNKVHGVLNSKPVAVRAGKLPEVYGSVKFINARAAELAAGISALLSEITTLQLDGNLFSHCMPCAHLFFLKTVRIYETELASIEADTVEDVSLSAKAALISSCLSTAQGFIDPTQTAELTVAKNLMVKLSNYDVETFSEGFAPVIHSCERFFVSLTENVLTRKIMSVMLPLLPDALLRLTRRAVADCKYY